LYHLSSSHFTTIQDPLLTLASSISSSVYKGSNYELKIDRYNASRSWYPGALVFLSIIFEFPSSYPP
jgi:hypothetical protein